jgi:5-methylcytosine-specific restriction endonuclease McrA
MIISCQHCNKKFYISPSSYKRGNRKHCSFDCKFKNSHAWNKGLKGWGNAGSFKVGHCHSRDTLKKLSMASSRNRGKHASHYIDGRTPVYTLIRHLPESKQWIKSVFERDGYRCQECNITNTYLEAHHIYPFRSIMSDFLKMYSQFSPIEDKEILSRLAQSYGPFWDISNGQTLCKNCHKNKRKVLAI